MARQLFFFSSRRRHTRCLSDWSSDVCSSDLEFQRPALEALRQPLEDGVISVARVGGRAVFPARVQVVRSEERRVGKECRSRCGLCQESKRNRGNSKTIWTAWHCTPS